MWPNQNQIRRGSQLTSQLLGYARQRPSQAKPVLLNELVAEVLGAFGRTRKNIVIRPDLHPGLCTVNADEGQLEQALLNLFINASDAMPDGGTLTLRTRNVSHLEIASSQFQLKAGRYVEFQVTDTGVGMTPETMDRIFDPFFTTKEMGRVSNWRTFAPSRPFSPHRPTATAWMPISPLGPWPRRVC